MLMRTKSSLFASGFSLLEVSISLFIIGIVSTMTVSQLTAIGRTFALHKTHANIETVIRALGVFCAQRDMSLPYPSRADKNIGIQDESMKDAFGFVPFGTIGIMRRAAMNGDGIPLLYKRSPVFMKKINDQTQRTLGIKEFVSGIANDKVAIVIKSVNRKGKDEVVVWYSEKNFIASYVGNSKPQVERQTGLGIRIGS
jgi:prepilin-type N-terminal cleavage/methylation domain-containing protein